MQRHSITNEIFEKCNTDKGFDSYIEVCIDDVSACCSGPHNKCKYRESKENDRNNVGPITIDRNSEGEQSNGDSNNLKAHDDDSKFRFVDTFVCLCHDFAYIVRQ